MRSLGAERSVDLFPPASWSGFDATVRIEADYPGLRPTGSWRLSPSGELHGLEVAGAGWRDRETGEHIDHSDRYLILAYGSNADPTKLLAKVGFFVGDSVVALRAAVFGWAAAWCNARRRRDRSVVATLVPAPGRMEVHPVFALTPHQLDAMDDWEGHPDYYRRIHHQDPVLLESGRLADGVQVYLGTPELRPVLLVGGRHLLCADVPYGNVDRLVGP
jgi:hypothetical protein